MVLESGTKNSDRNTVLWILVVKLTFKIILSLIYYCYFEKKNHLKAYCQGIGGLDLHGF